MISRIMLQKTTLVRFCSKSDRTGQRWENMALAVMMQATVTVAAAGESLYAIPLNLDGDWEFQMDTYRVRLT